MSIDLKGILSDIVNGGNEEEDVQRPCRNCPSDCAIAPDACDECKEYKEKLIDALYNVEHLDAFYDRYEVTGEASAPTAGTINCPYCGGPSSAALTVCEYCGMQLREDSGKIRVASASEIPNPILEAQDLIFARRAAVSKYEKEEGGGLLGGLLEAAASLIGGGSDDAFGGKMTEDEIKETAAAYGVSVSSYLNGLDNGTYLTRSAKARADSAAASGHGMNGAAYGAAGAGIGMAGAAAMFGNRPGMNQMGVRPPHGVGNPPPPPPGHGMRPPQGVRPPQGGMNQQWGRPPQSGMQHGFRPPQNGMGHPQGARPPQGGMGRPPQGGMNRPQGIRPPQGGTRPTGPRPPMPGGPSPLSSFGKRPGQPRPGKPGPGNQNRPGNGFPKGKKGK